MNQTHTTQSTGPKVWIVTIPGDRPITTVWGDFKSAQRQAADCGSDVILEEHEVYKTTRTSGISDSDIEYMDEQRLAHLEAAEGVLGDDGLEPTRRLIANAAHLRAAAAHQLAIVRKDDISANEAWELTMIAAELDGSA